MAKVQTTTKTSTSTTTSKSFIPKGSAAGILFNKENHKWMIIAGAVSILGFILMIGGASKDPNQFNTGEVYSFMRTTIAPILVLAGLVIFVFAIMKSPENIAGSVKDLLNENKITDTVETSNLK